MDGRTFLHFYIERYVQFPQIRDEESSIVNVLSDRSGGGRFLSALDSRWENIKSFRI